MSIHTLEDKLALLVDDIKDLGRRDKIIALTSFFKKELGLMEQTRQLTKKDLIAIQSRATGIMISISAATKIEGEILHKDDRLLRTYCIAAATHEVLRAKGLSPYIIDLLPNKPEGVCQHHEIKFNDNKYLCQKCGKELRPILWEELQPKS